MNNSPLISIVMPAYNSEEFIAKSITSIISQTYRFWELLICDDCSSDNTCEVIEEFSRCDSRIRLLRNDINKGPAESRNTCIDHSKGDYVAFLDSDDLWKPFFLERQLSFLKKKQARGVFCSYSRIDEYGASMHSDFIVPDRVSYSDVLKTNSIPCLTVLLKKELVGSTRMSDKGIEDLNFWLDLLKKENYFYGNSSLLANYRIRANSRSSSKLKLIKPQWLTYRKCQGLSRISSFYYLLNWAFWGFKKHFL